MKMVLVGVTALIFLAPPSFQTQAGTAQITGQVVTNTQPAAPIRRVLLTLTGSAIRHPELALTGDDGRFTFRDLPPGRYTISATKTGYVRQYYGAKRPDVSSGVPIVVATGQKIDISLPMTRAGAISGTLLLPPGLPTGTLRINVQRAVTRDGERRFESVGGAMGVGYDATFRIPRLTPGDYQLFITAGVIEMQQTTPDLVRWASQPSVAGAPAPPPPPPQLITFAPVFFPGTTRAAEAGTITLGAGEERDVTFAVPVVASARLSGQVLDANGQPPPSFQVWLIDESAPVPRLSLQPRLEGNGRFSIAGVTPGSYLLAARAAPQGTPAAAEIAPPGHSVGQPTNAPLWAMETMTVSGDVPDIVLRLQPSRTVSGRVTAAPGSVGSPPPSRVTLTPLTTVAWNLSLVSGESDTDGRFEIPNVIPGRYRVNISPIGAANTARWAPLSAVAADRDVLDEGLDVPRGDNPPALAVTMTDRPTELSGLLLDSASRPVTEFALVAFSTDTKHWRATSRRVVQARPGSDGLFVFSNLPPGEYYVCAVTDVDASQMSDASFLQQLIPSAFRVTLAAGEKKRQDMKIGSGG